MLDYDAAAIIDTQGPHQRSLGCYTLLLHVCDRLDWKNDPKAAEACINAIDEAERTWAL